MPAVTLGRPDRSSPYPAVCLDDRPGVQEAVAHLVELGHERIAHVGGRQDLMHGSGRREAWETAMRAAGLATDLMVPADFTAAAGAAATRELLGREDAPTAIVYANDVMAIAGLTVAHEQGLTPPRDLSIVGFDDTELAAHVHPRSRPCAPTPRLGPAAARTLLEHSTDAPTTSSCRPRGWSCARPPPGGDPHDRPQPHPAHRRRPGARAVRLWR